MSIFTFTPFYQERIWGGSNLAQLYGRPVPEGKKIGESWELVDRPDHNSPLTDPAGEAKTLHDLWTTRRKEVFGSAAPDSPRFPILIKLLDCQEKLSVQVHPPAAKAAALKGEPKTEMWYFLQTTPDAAIYVGLKKGVTREAFEKAVGTPDLSKLLHTLPTRPGESMFLPSGRVHAIGAGNVILEIQQNSDTTYRVDDWGRLDDEGNARELHRAQALESIRFNDPEPFFTQPHSERVLECPFFSTYRAFVFPGEYRAWTGDGISFNYHFVADGEVTLDGHTFKEGSGWLMSADHPRYELSPGKEGAEIVTVRFGV